MDANSTARTSSRPPAVSTAPDRADAAHAEGWLEGVRAARAAMRALGSWKPDEHLEGWMDAATLQPVDPARLAITSSRYARGYAAGAKQYERALGASAGGGGYDAE